MSLKCGLVAALVMTGACDVLGTTDKEPEFKLTVTERSATTLSLSWAPMPQSVGNAYVVDYFGGVTTCAFFATKPDGTHDDVLHVTGTSVQLTGLTPSTSYQIHVHPRPISGTSQITNTVLVSTLAAGAGPAPVAAADYNPCK